LSVFTLVWIRLAATNEGLAEQIEDLHKTIGEVGHRLIGLNAAAPLFHHVVLRDGTVRLMPPGRR